ncbi:hypothetical protein GCM10020331_000650 [Ectobacillus funiculus]
MDTLYTHCAGLDVHQKEIVVCVLMGSSDEELMKEVRTFPTMTKNLYEMLRWLERTSDHSYRNGKYRNLLEACV